MNSYTMFEGRYPINEGQQNTKKRGTGQFM